MSISSTDGQGSNSSPSQASSPVLSSRHGSPQDHKLEAVGPGCGAVGSAPIAGSTAAAGPAAGNSDVAVSTSGDFGNSPQKVTELRTRDVKKVLSGQCRGTNAKWQSSNDRKASSRNGSAQSRSAQRRGKQTGPVYAQSDHLETSNNFHDNVIQFVGRRNQVISGNHLLNFHFDPIPRPQPRIPPPKRQQKIRPYNKDLFLQANYKFFVLDTGNYVVESMDPDEMLQWEDVVCVRYSTPFHVQCPICLESPMGAHITSCGHIYCFPCILRYLLLGEKNHEGDYWKKCPLCFMMISVKDLYTVYIDSVKQYNVGDHVDFTLLTRPKDSSVPSQKNYQKLVSVPCDNDSICDSFSKFTLTLDVELSVREARKDLNDWLAKAELGLVDDLEKLPYVCAALDQLDQRMKNWAEHHSFGGGTPSTSAFLSSTMSSSTADKVQLHASSLTVKAVQTHSKVSESPARRELTVQQDASNGLKIGGEAPLVPPSDISEHYESPEKLLTDDRNKALQKHLFGGKDANERDMYFFYQSIDGQHIILHPLNTKCLLHHYKSYDSLPERIGGQILQLETVTQSEAARKRYRFLSHFSLTTTFQLCEIDLSGILPANALSPFIDEIKNREKQRKRLAKKEEKARAQAAELHEKPLPYDYKHSSCSAAAFSLDDFEALGDSGVPSNRPPVVGERKLFSDVARLGFASGHDSPCLRGDGSGDVSNNTESAGEASSVMGQRMTTLSFASAMSASKATSPPEAPKIDGFGKKGKKPTRVLLSTAGGRRY